MSCTVNLGFERRGSRSWATPFAVTLILLTIAVACITCGCDDSANSVKRLPTEGGNDSDDNARAEQPSVAVEKNTGPSPNEPAAEPFRDTTPLILAILDRDKERFAQLLDVGSDPNEWDRYGRNAVSVAAGIRNSQYWMHLALLHGGDPNARAPDSIEAVPLLGGGFAPLHIAASHQDNEINVRLLVEAGADVNALNAYGMTPLGLAVESSCFEGAAYLVNHGADPDAKCNGGLTIREMVDSFTSDDYPLVLSPEDASSLKYLQKAIAAEDSE